jgi:hypothetical protein
MLFIALLLVLLIILMKLQGDNLLINLLVRPCLTPCFYTLNINGNVPMRYGLPLQIWWVETNYVFIVHKLHKLKSKANKGIKIICSKGIWHGVHQTLKSHFSWEVNASTLSFLFSFYLKK